MRLSSLIVVTAAAALACSAPAGRSAALDTQITSLPSSVKQGATLHLAALSVGGYTCSLSVRYADGRVQALGKRRIVVFGVAWTWRVPAGAAPGFAHAVLTCGTAGRAESAFMVTRRRVAAQVVTVTSGLTQTPHALDNGTDVAYGIVLRNASPDTGAVDVQVGVNVLDKAKHVIGSSSKAIAAIPAGATYYLGGVVTTRDRTAAVSIQPIVRVGGSKGKAIVAPVVSDVRVTQHAEDAGAYVDGQITNGSNATLSPAAVVSAVFFDGAGDVIGGGSTVPPFSLPSQASAAFEISTAVPAAAIASVRVSVEPQFIPAG